MLILLLIHLFLHFTFWPSFPICNLADYYLSIGIVFLIIGFVIEFKKEYKALKAEEEAEKLALEQGKDVTGESQEDLLKKLQEKEKENKEEVDSENKEELGEEKHITLFAMQPMPGGNFRQQILGYSLMNAMGITQKEIDKKIR